MNTNYFEKKSMLNACIQNNCTLDFILQKIDIKIIIKCINETRVFSDLSKVTIENIKKEIKVKFPIENFPELYI